MKNEEAVIANTIAFVKGKLHSDRSGHDWWHVYRVWKMALFIALRENANRFEVQLSALLHDIEDWKLIENQTPPLKNVVKDWLKSQKVEDRVNYHVCKIIDDLSFKGAGVPSPMHTLEGKVVQDADRLDAIGAIGIARAFAFGGFHNREIHNPDLLPTIHKSFEEYKKDQSTSINHFYEKLLLLKDLMNTTTAKQISIERHQFIEGFLTQFMAEWRGEK